MQDISISEAYAILKVATAVELEGQLIHPTLYELEGDYRNVFLTLHWQEEYDGEWLDFSVDFEEGDNEKCILDGSTLILVNTDGQEETMEILVPYYHKGS